MAQAQKPVVEKTPVTIKISEVLAMLNNGQDRRAIAKHYGITLADVKRIFENDKLKGKRVKPTVGVNLVDDTEGEEVAASTEVKAAAPAATTDAAPAAQVSETPAAPADTEAAAPQVASADKGVW